MQILQKKGQIKIHRKNYIEEIQRVQVDNLSQKDRVLLQKETQQLRRIAGQLNWVLLKEDMTWLMQLALLVDGLKMQE